MNIYLFTTFLKHTRILTHRAHAAHGEIQEASWQQLGTWLNSHSLLLKLGKLVLILCNYRGKWMPDMTTHTDTHTHMDVSVVFSISVTRRAVRWSNGINCETHLADSSSSAGKNCLRGVCTCVRMHVWNTARAQQDRWGLDFPQTGSGIALYMCLMFLSQWSFELFGLIPNRFLKLTPYVHSLQPNNVM